MTDYEVEYTLELMKKGWSYQYKLDVLITKRLDDLAADIKSMKEYIAGMAAEDRLLKARVHAIEAHLFTLESMGTFKDEGE